MDNLKDLDKKIYLTRKKLENLIASHNLMDIRVIKLSRKLDDLIIQYYKSRYGC